MKNTKKISHNKRILSDVTEDILALAHAGDTDWHWKYYCGVMFG